MVWTERTPPPIGFQKILAPLVLDSSIKVPLLQGSTSYKTMTVRLCSHPCPQPPIGTHSPHFATLPLCPNPLSYHKYQSNRRGSLRGRVYIFICISFRTTFSLSQLFYAFCHASSMPCTPHQLYLFPVLNRKRRSHSVRCFRISFYSIKNRRPHCTFLIPSAKRLIFDSNPTGDQ